MSASVVLREELFLSCAKFGGREVHFGSQVTSLPRPLTSPPLECTVSDGVPSKHLLPQVVHNTQLLTGWRLSLRGTRVSVRSSSPCM